MKIVAKASRENIMKKGLVALLCVFISFSICEGACEEKKNGRLYTKICLNDSGSLVKSEEIWNENTHIKMEWDEYGNIMFEDVWNVKKAVRVVKKFNYGEVASRQVCRDRDQVCVNEGPQRYWFQDIERLEHEENYKNGVKDGIQRLWYESGVLKRIESYNNGNLEGIWKEWYEDGQLKSQGSYKHGYKHGLWREWDESGILVEERKF